MCLRVNDRNLVDLRSNGVVITDAVHLDKKVEADDS